MNDSGFLYDTNLWIGLTFPNHPHHAAAHREYALASTDRPAIFCRTTQLSFLRIATTPAILRQYSVAALTNNDALKSLEEFLSRSNTECLDEPPGTVLLWQELSARATAS